MLKRKLITALAASVSVFAGIGLASAADLEAVPYNKTPAYIVPVYDWSGAYVGVNLGYGWGRSVDTSFLGLPPALTDTVTSNMNGFVGGGQIGYNLQMQNWLVGLEADFQGTNQSSNHSFSCAAAVCANIASPAGPVAGPAVSVTQTQHLDFFGTVRGRVGLAVVPTVLLYGTGGLAYGQVDTDSTLPGSTRAQNYNLGWTAGGGIEGAIGGGWTARVEYLYLDLGKVSGSFTSTSLLALTGTNALVSGFSSRVTDNIVRVGVNYRFGEPVIAKY